MTRVLDILLHLCLALVVAAAIPLAAALLVMFAVADALARFCATPEEKPEDRGR